MPTSTRPKLVAGGLGLLAIMLAGDGLGQAGDALAQEAIQRGQAAEVTPQLDEATIERATKRGVFPKDTIDEQTAKAALPGQAIRGEKTTLPGGCCMRTIRGF